MAKEMGLQKKDKIVFLIYFIVLFGYMPTARYTDTLISLVAVLILIANFSYNFLIQKKYRLESSICWYVGFVAYGFLTCLISSNIDNYVTFISRIFPLVLVGIVCISQKINSEEEIVDILRLMMVSACIAAIRFCYYTPWSTYLRGDFGSLLDDVTNYNNYTTHLAVVCIIAAYFALIKREKWCWFPFVFLFAVCMVGGSRKNLVMIPLVVLYFAIFQGNIKKKMKTLVIVILILGGGIMQSCISISCLKSKRPHWRCLQDFLQMPVLLPV